MTQHARAQGQGRDAASDDAALPGAREPFAWPVAGAGAETPLGRLLHAELAHLEASDTDPAAVLDAGPAPTSQEVSEAFRTVLRHVRARRHDEWGRAVEGLADSPSLAPDQLYQAQRYAALKRWVLEHVPMGEPSALAALIPDRVGQDTNTARAIERLRGERQLLAVPYKRGWRYPLAQVDHRGRVHEAIPALLAHPGAQHYEPWEIVRFLARPLVHYPPPAVGRPVVTEQPFVSLDELVDVAFERAPAQAPPSYGPSPFELLAAGDTGAFERAVARFLGPDGADEASGESPAAA